MARLTRGEGAQSNSDSVFISASIPDPTRWSGDFDPLEITDAVVAVARTLLTAGYQLVTAAHPTIAPLLLYVAAELDLADNRNVSIYQSRLFENDLPAATLRFEELGVGRIVRTRAEPGDEPEPGRWDESLRVMRQQMLLETRPIAAVFIGGMEGISEEFTLFNRLEPGGATYALGKPGGAARDLPETRSLQLERELRDGDVYPSVASWIHEDLRSSASG